MKTKLYNYLLLLSGAALLTGCPPPEQTTPPEQTDSDLNNQFSYDGQIYDITAAGMDFYGASWLYFESGDDTWTYFALYLPQGEISITESTTFTFDQAADGTPGTFSDGWFETGMTEVEVVSGTIVVEVSGSKYTVKADCKCDDGNDLIVRYTGALDYDGPTGTTTFRIGDLTFPYAGAGMTPPETDEYYGCYITEFYILASNLIDVSCECELVILHSESSPAGTYTFGAEVSPEAGAAYGEFDVYNELEERTLYDGILTEGTVTIGIEGDVYTIAFEDVKLDTGDGLVDVTGTYTGTVFIETDEEYVRTAAVKTTFQRAERAVRSLRPERNKK